MRHIIGALIALPLIFGSAQAQPNIPQHLHEELQATAECEIALKVHFNLAAGATVLAMLLTSPTSDPDTAVAIADTVENTRAALRVIALRRQRAIDTLMAVGADEAAMTDSYENMVEQSIVQFWSLYEQAIEQPNLLVMLLVPLLVQTARCQEWRP